MPRGVRKTALEKLQEELTEVQESIKQYKESLITLDEKEKEIQDKIKLNSLRKYQQYWTSTKCLLWI